MEAAVPHGEDQVRGADRQRARKVNSVCAPQGVLLGQLPGASFDWAGELESK